MADFEKNKKLKIKNGGELVIDSKLGAGGQGTVYKVTYEGKPYALKWYHIGVFKDKWQDFYKNLEVNISQGAPTASFLWPLGITEIQEGSFGYIMDLRPSGYDELTYFFVGGGSSKQVHFKSFMAQTTAAINIIEGFRELHNRGYSYQDINNGNFFINNETGKVLICDNDNVSPAGTNLGIQGKQRWMAPEIVTCQNEPDKYSDRFSLSVVLFRLLFINHPLEGRYSTPPCMTKAAEQKYYGTDPVFVYDPKNSINLPVPGTDRNLKLFWNVYPQYVRDAFIRAFSKEVMMKQKPRITEIEWLKLFFRLRSEIGICSYCKKETFFSIETPNCIECKKTLPAVSFIETPHFTIPVIADQSVYSWQADTSLSDINEIVAKIVRKPDQPDMLGIRNVSNHIVNVKLPDGSIKSLPPQKTMPVKDDFIIDFSGKSQFTSRIKKC